MRRKLGWLASTLMIALGVWASVHAAGEQFAGKWTGTWQGEAGSGGRFDLTLERGADGAMTGGVDVGSDPSGDYVAKFVMLSFDGNKMSGRYSYTPDEQADIMVTATFEGNLATGTWSLVPKGQEMSMATGTWTVTKQ